jgi:hypothetical protein
MGEHVPRALVDEFRVNKTELFVTGDTLEVDINRSKGNVVVDIYVDTENVNIDTLRRQFTADNCSLLIYDILFEYSPTYIYVRDKRSGKVVGGIEHRTER